MSENLSRSEAFKWIRLNWKRLVAEGKLDQALKRYMDAYLRETPTEKKIVQNDPTSIFDGKL